MLWFYIYFLSVTIGVSQIQAFQRLCLESQSWLLWVKAVCIGKVKTEENSLQVRLMRRDVKECQSFGLGPEADCIFKWRLDKSASFCVFYIEAGLSYLIL